MKNNFISDFKNNFKFLEEYGFVFSKDPFNPNRPCYKNSYGEIVFWIQKKSGIGFQTEIYYQINGWKYPIDIEEEYKKNFKQTTLFKDKIKLFKKLFEYMVNSSGKFYNLQINKNIPTSLKEEEITDINVFKKNTVLFNHRNRAVTNITGFLSIVVFLLIECCIYLFIYEYSKSYLTMKIANIILLISIMITQLLLVYVLRKNLHIISMLSILIYSFIPLILYFFFDRKFDYQVETVFVCLMVFNMLVHLIIYFFKRHNYYLLNGMIPLLYPICINFFKALILDEYLFLWEQKIGIFIIIGLIIGIIVSVIIIVVDKTKKLVKEYIGTFFGVFLVGFIIFGIIPYFITQNINYAFDDSNTVIYNYIVVDKKIVRGNGRYSSNNYYLIIEFEGKQEELSVNRRVYNDFEINEIIKLNKHEGLFSKQYYEYIEEKQR